MAFVAASVIVACGSDERAGAPTEEPTDSGLPVFETSSNDTGTAPNDAGGDTSTPPDTNVPGDSATPDTGTPPGDATFEDIPSTRDTEVDAILLEAGGGDTRPDTELPDVNSLSDTRVDVAPDSPTPF